MSRPDPYMNGAGRPPAQGHYPSYPGRGYSDDGYSRPPPQATPQQQPQQPYFDPPPRDPYPPSADDHYYPYEDPALGHQYADHPYAEHPSTDRQYADREYADRGYADYGPPPQNGGPEPDRPYAPNEPGPHDFNQVTPYDDEKAEAEWRRGVEDAYTYQRRPPPPPSDRDLEFERRRAYEEEERMRDIEYERERERQRRIDEDRYYEERERERDRDRERERRKRRDEESMREKALRYPSDPKKGGRDVFGGSEGERGLGAKIAGGAGGALLGHEMKGNVLGTVGGAVVGAIAANFVERRHEKRQEEKMPKRRSRDDGYPGSRAPSEYPPPGRRMDDVRRTGRDGNRPEVRERDMYERERDPRSRSRGGEGFRDRLARSLSRARSQTRPARRRDSYDSYDSEFSHRR